MESINNVLNMVRPNIYMASNDLNHAFFSATIHLTHQTYLKFDLTICFNLHACQMDVDLL